MKFVILFSLTLTVLALQSMEAQTIEVRRFSQIEPHQVDLSGP